MEIIYTLDGKDFKVMVDEFDIARTIRKADEEWSAEHFTVAETMEYGNVVKEDYFKDLKDLEYKLGNILETPELLDEHILEVRKKKNGDFWKGAVRIIERYDNISEYYTEFTNAWSVMCIYLKVTGARESKLVVGPYTIKSS